MDWFTVGALFLLFSVPFSLYVYREAKRENRSSPKLRGIGWGVMGIIGAYTYLTRTQNREQSRLIWFGISTYMIAVWTVGALGLWGWSPGIRHWLGLLLGLFVLYWQFELDLDESRRTSISN